MRVTIFVSSSVYYYSLAGGLCWPKLVLLMCVQLVHCQWGSGGLVLGSSAGNDYRRKIYSLCISSPPVTRRLSQAQVSHGVDRSPRVLEGTCRVSWSVSSETDTHLLPPHSIGQSKSHGWARGRVWGMMETQGKGQGPRRMKGWNHACGLPHVTPHCP